MARRASLITAVTATVGLVVPGITLVLPAAATPVGAKHCSAGPRTLSPPGARLYPDTGNGGYTRPHTPGHPAYDASTNIFPPGNTVTLTDRAPPCLPSVRPD